MDPDDRLTEELGAELRRSLAEMRLHPEFREQLTGRMLATSSSRWRRWLGSWPVAARHPGALVGVAVAAIVLAVAVPLALSHTSPSRSSEALTLLPPSASAGKSHAAELAPLGCAGAVDSLTVTPTRATLAPGQRSTFRVVEDGPECTPQVTVTGPSPALVTLALTNLPKSSSGGGEPPPAFLVTWTGKRATASGAAGASAAPTPNSRPPLAPGVYHITVRLLNTSPCACTEIPSPLETVSIEITIRK